MLSLLALQELSIACNSTQTRLVNSLKSCGYTFKNLFSNIYYSAVVCPLDSGVIVN